MIANITFYIIIFWYLPPYNNFIKTRRMLPGIIRKASPVAVNGNGKCTDFGNRECSDFGNNNAPISVTTIHNFR